MKKKFVLYKPYMLIFFYYKHFLKLSHLKKIFNFSSDYWLLLFSSLWPIGGRFWTDVNSRKFSFQKVLDKCGLAYKKLQRKSVINLFIRSNTQTWNYFLFPSKWFFSYFLRIGILAFLYTGIILSILKMRFEQIKTNN